MFHSCSRHFHLMPWGERLSACWPIPRSLPPTIAIGEHPNIKSGDHTQGQPQRLVAADLGLARAVPCAGVVQVGAGPQRPWLRGWRPPRAVWWLYQLGLAAHFSITLQGGAGVRVVCQFLELSGLSAFVGASYGTHQGLNAALEEALVAVAHEQRGAYPIGISRCVRMRPSIRRSVWWRWSRCRAFFFWRSTRRIARRRPGRRRSKRPWSGWTSP